jgi:AcrR family transcriptional regulator
MAVMTSGIRARARAQTTDEIKTIARRHLASDGANLSLRAVARDLGVVSSAIYRYFASRDDLLTALILDAYNSLGASVEAADGAAGKQEDARWMAVCHAVRDWALASPHEYALVYGSPVPGYQAPQDTVPAATRSVRVLGGILQDAALAGRFAAEAGDTLTGEAARTVDGVRASICPDAPLVVVSRAMGAWVQLFGLVSFELFGQLENVVEDKDAFFEHQMRAQADYIGL